MYKSIRTLTLALAAIVGIGAAASASAQILVLGGNPPGSLWYAQSQAIATTVNKHTDMRVDVLPQGGSSYFPMFGTDEVDMGLANPIEALFASRAEWPFEGVNNGEGYEMRTVMLGSPISLSLVVREDSDIKTLEDLPGQRVVADYGAFSGATLTGRSVLANAGLTVDDVDLVSVSSYPEGVRAVMEGRADAAVGSIGSGIIQELEAAHGARLLEIDPSDEAMARVREVAPAFVPRMMEAGLPGLKQDQYALSYSTTVFARPNLDEERVHTFIGALWDHYEELKGIHRSLTLWTPDRFASADAVIPYHPAAVEFYREKGVWTDEIEAHNNALLNQ